MNTPTVKESGMLVQPGRSDKMLALDTLIAQTHFQKMLEAFGYDVEADEHLKDTPRRVVAMYRELFFDEPWKFTTFDNVGKDTGIVLVRDIPFTSLCAHHFALFTGVAHVAYVPNLRLCGLSKLARTIKSFAKGPNVQEWIGQKSVDFLMEELSPFGAAVILKAEHTCMTERGVKSHGSSTVTSSLRGCFYNEPSARAELMSLLSV